MRFRFLLYSLLSLILSACAAQGPGPTVVAVDGKPMGCATRAVALDTDFASAAAAACTPLSATRLALTIAPEDAPPINCSAWYAFRLTPRRPGSVTVDLDYTACEHRYWPKTSTDGVTWTALPQTAVTIREVDGQKQAQLRLQLDTSPLFVAGQEIVAGAAYDAWLAGAAQHPAVQRSRLGVSAQQRPIDMLTLAAPGSSPRETVVLVGRQHPPEVTGALAMFAFMDRLMADDPLAVRYRTRFRTIAVPLLNPDGVEHGHWRHNTGGVDLNRDWGPFTQPETRLMDQLLKNVAADPEQQLTLLLDFHSTWKDVVYTLTDEQVTRPADFTPRWIARMQDVLGDGLPVERDPSHNADRPVAKAFVFEAYGVPTATFELGDETPRAEVALRGRVAAQAMMEILLNDS